MELRNNETMEQTNCISATELKSMVHGESINQGYATIASYTYSLQSTEHNQ